MKHCILLTCLLATMSSLLSASTTLNDYRWTHRILVVDANRSETIGSLDLEIAAHMAELKDRKLVVIAVLSSTLKVYGSTLETEQTTELRQQLIELLDGHSALLIGLDGGIKARYSKESFSFDQVFDRIDAMPMRRAELRKR